MGKLNYHLSVSLDGFMEAPGGDIEWGTPDAELHQHFNDLEKKVDVFLYGRRLYENMSAYWPTADQDPSATAQTKEYARIWLDKPKVVFSTTLKHVDWNSRLVNANIEEEVKRLKADLDGDITVGGAGLARSLMELDLIDEYGVYIHPIVLGGGKPMFGPLENRIQVRLLECRTFPQGVVLLRYERAASRY